MVIFNYTGSPQVKISQKRFRGRLFFTHTVYVQKMFVTGDVPLNVNFALISEQPLDAADVRVSALTKSDEYPICIALIRMQYEIYREQCNRQTDGQTDRLAHGICRTSLHWAIKNTVLIRNTAEN